MPTSPARACRCGGTIRGERCDRCGPIASVTLTKRASAAARGYDRTWRRLRAEFLAGHPWCHDCEQRGIDEQSEEVHHVEPIAAAPHRRLDPTNLMALCKSCHSSRTAAEQDNAAAARDCVVVKFRDRERAIVYIRTHKRSEDLVFDFDAIATSMGFAGFPRPVDVAQLVVAWRRELVKRIKSEQIRRRVWVLVSDAQQAEGIARDTKGLLVRV